MDNWRPLYKPLLIEPAPVISRMATDEEIAHSKRIAKAELDSYNNRVTAIKGTTRTKQI